MPDLDMETEADAASGWFSDDDHETAAASSAGPFEPKAEAFDESTNQARAESEPRTEPQPEPRKKPRRARAPGSYGSRTCRICLETELPKYPTGITSTLGIRSASFRPTYASDDPALGRLLSPCKCRGSQKYVHEGCLTAWRLANPTTARNYFQCPTCKFNYRMARLHWAAVVSSRAVRLALTVVLLILSLFILGWTADPILDLWFDPVGTVSDAVTSVVSDIEAREEVPRYYDEEPFTWTEHFLKGFFSLGIIGFVKAAFVLTPWDWWNLGGTSMFGRRGGGGIARRGGTGRARLENMNLVFVFLGAITFLMGIWKVVGALSARVLRSVSDRVLDVADGDDEDEFEDDGGGNGKKE